MPKAPSSCTTPSPPRRGSTSPALTEADVARRLPVWIALSDLFLDTETQPFTYAHIARVLAESGYDRAEQFRILLDEVTPAFGGNMFQVAGVWDLWTDAEVRRRVLVNLRRPWWGRWLRRALRHDVEAWWAAIEAFR